MNNNIKQYDFSTKDEMLEKLQGYAINPDDDNIRIKNQIYDILLHCPELLYALHNEELESELFDENGNLNIDENGEPLGQWDLYFGKDSNIKPYLYIPNTQTDMRHYVCYQTSFTTIKKYNSYIKEMIVTFNIFVNGQDGIDNLTGIPRHDLIASIIREKIAWIGIEIENPVPNYDKESVTDNDFLVRTLQFKLDLPNSIAKTNNGNTAYSNKMW